MNKIPIVTFVIFLFIGSLAYGANVSVKLYDSSFCYQGSYMDTIDSTTNCNESAETIGGIVRGISVNGDCKDIFDNSYLAACETFKHYNSDVDTPELYIDEDCKSELIAQLNKDISCDFLAYTEDFEIPRPGAVKIGEKCERTFYASFLTVCRLNKKNNF